MGWDRGNNSSALQSWMDGSMDGWLVGWIDGWMECWRRWGMGGIEFIIVMLNGYGLQKRRGE